MHMSAESAKMFLWKATNLKMISISESTGDCGEVKAGAVGGARPAVREGEAGRRSGGAQERRGTQAGPQGE